MFILVEMTVKIIINFISVVVDLSDQHGTLQKLPSCGVDEEASNVLQDRKEYILVQIEGKI